MIGKEPKNIICKVKKLSTNLQVTQTKVYTLHSTLYNQQSTILMHFHISLFFLFALSNPFLQTLQALEMDPTHYVVRKNYATFLRDYPEARNARNESVVDETPVAKALNKGNTRSSNRATSHHSSPTKRKTPTKNKTPSKFRPRKLEPELESWSEK